MLDVKTCLVTGSLVMGAGWFSPAPAMAATTGYWLESGGDNSQLKVPAYLWYDYMTTSSDNLTWVVQNDQIGNL
jgi:hypothetical protein